MKSLLKYIAIIIIIFALFSFLHSVLLNTMPLIANEITGGILVVIMIWLYFKWRKAMHLEETIVNIQFIEA